MVKDKWKRMFAGMLSAILVFTSSGLSSIGPLGAFAADVPDDYPVQFSLAWDDATVSDTTEINGNTMTLTPYSDGSADTTGGTTAKLVLDYTLGSYDAGDGTMVPLTAEAGDIEIRLPAYIFKDRNGNAVGKAYLGIGQQKDSDSGFYYSIDTKDTDTLNDDELVIKNFTTITGDQTFRCNITYWSGQAHAVADGFESTFKASSTIRDGSEIRYKKDSNDLTVKYQTSTEIEKINPVCGSMTYPKLYKNWNTSWGTKPSGLTDYSADHENGYFYVAWPVTTVLSQWPTQPGTLNEMTAEVSTDAGTSSDVVAATVRSYTFSETASLPTSGSALDDYQSGYIVTAHKASEFEVSGMDTICITADIKTSFTGVDGCTSGAGIIQIYNYDSLSRTGSGGTFIPYQYAPSPIHDDESDGFISLLQVSDFGEVLPLKSKTQPNKNADNAWDFVMTGEASNVSELTAGYVTDNEEPASEGSGSSAESSYSLKKSVPETSAGTESSGTDTGDSEKSESSAESSAPAETESLEETPDTAESSKDTESSAETEPSAASLMDEVLGVQDAGAEEGTKTYGINYYTMQLTDDLLILEGEDLEAGDYQFDNIPYIKIQGIAAAADLDEPNVTMNAGTGEWTVSGAEVLTWKPGEEAIEGLTVYYKVGNGDWKEYDYEGLEGELAGAGINGVTAIKAEYQSYYGYTAVQVFTNVDIVKTQHVMDIIGDKSSVTLWNVDSMRSYDYAGNLRTAHSTDKYGGTLRDHLAARDEAYKAEDAAAAYTESMKQGILDGTLIQQHDFDNIELTKAFIESKASKKVSYTNDTSAGRVTANYTLEAYLVGQSDYKSVLNALVTRQNSDTFYDLLPAGMSYAKDSAKANLIGQTGVYADVSVEQVSNYKDTGRTLLIFHVSTKEGQSNYKDYKSGYTLTFTAYYPWEEIQEYGRTPRNSMAYKSGEGNFEGYPDNGGNIREKDLLAELDGVDSDVKDTVYADVNASLIWNTASINGFSKKVKAGDDEGYASRTSVYEGQDYSYKLRYGSEADTTSEGIILYDVLENNYGTNEYWKGTLKSIDTSAVESKGIQPVVYYSTKDGIVITNDSAPDLSDTSVWSRTAPENLADVTAIAVDLSTKQDGTPFVLDANAAVSVTINMTAPADGVAYEENGTLAYNTSWIKATTKNTASMTETTAVTQSDATTVAIVAPSVTVAKVNDGGAEDDTFELTLSISGASADTEYPVTYSDDESGERSAVLTTDANGNGSYTSTLKGGESYCVKLPMGTKYTVSEEPGSGYAPSYIITGESAKIVKVGDKAEAGEILATKEETVDETSDVTVTFTNGSTIRKVQIWKQISGRYENRGDHKFDFRLDVTGKAGDKYKVTLPDGSEDEISLGLDGKASYDFTLTGSEIKEGAEMLTVELPIGATYQVTELADGDYSSDYKPKFYIGTAGTFADQSGTGESGKDFSTAVETADEEDDKTLTIKFTNTGIPADLHIEKEVAGNGADKDDSFEYVAHFTGLKAGETYNLDGYHYMDIPEETPEGVTMFLSGKEFNYTVKSFNYTNIGDYTSDYKIISFIHSEEAPGEDVSTVIVSTDDSAHEILAWFDNGTLYWYSEAETVYLNYDADSMFYYLRSLKNISGLEDVDTSYTVNMSKMFYYCTSLVDISTLANWNMNSVTNMAGLFYHCQFTDINSLANWDVSNVTDMNQMFSYTKITNVNALANWDVGSVANMKDMFYHCSSLADISSLSDWNVSSVKDMNCTFAYTSIASTEGLSDWDVSSVTNMAGMFSVCESLIDLSGLKNWDVSNVEAMESMFIDCSKLEDLTPLSNWDTSSVYDMSFMFCDMYSLKSLKGLENWDFSGFSDDDIWSQFWAMFECDEELSDISALANWDVSNVNMFGEMFVQCYKLTDLSPLENWDMSHATYIHDMFQECTSLEDLEPLTDWDVSNVTDMSSMFYECLNLTNVEPLSNWDVRNVVNLKYTFENCTSLADASALSVWEVNPDAKGLNHNSSGAFYGCTLLEEHPSKFPTWYGAYRSTVSTADSGVAAASLLSLEDTNFVNAAFLAEAPGSGNSRDVSFEKDDYSTVSAARYNADSGRFVADENGEAYYVFHLKHGAFVDIKDLNPEVQYEIIEAGNSYLPSYSVTEGSEYTVSDDGRNEVPESDLSTGTETLAAGSSISYLFTNTKEVGQNVTITKKVDGGLADTTDQFHYTADLSGLEPGKEYTLKKATAPVDETEGTFDFSKYMPESFELTEELISELTGYTYKYASYATYTFDNKGNGLGITDRYGDREEGFDRLSIHVNAYNSYVALFYNSSSGNIFEMSIKESDISALPLTKSSRKKTLDLSGFKTDNTYTKVSGEDLQVLDGVSILAYGYGETTYTHDFAIIDGKLQVTTTTRDVSDGQRTESVTVNTGDSLYADMRLGNLWMRDSTEPEKAKVLLDKIPVTEPAAYFKKASEETFDFIADENGNATIEWDMKADDTYEIMGLPIGATYQVREDGAERYIASYEITDNNDADGVLDTVAKVKDANTLRNQDLATAKETVDLYEDVVITFMNTAPIPLLPDTGANTALLLTLIGMGGIAGYGIYETLKRRKRNKQ